MAVVKIPFTVTSELAPPFKLDEDYCRPNGVKSILLDKSKLEIVVKPETVFVPAIDQDVELNVFYVVGTVQYICNVFPIVQSDRRFDVVQYCAAFNSCSPSSECVPARQCDPKGWLSASGCVNVYEVVGGCCQSCDLPEIESVTIEDLAVANNPTSSMSPLCRNSCGEEEKRVVKWRGCIVITTTED